MGDVVPLDPYMVIEGLRARNEAQAQRIIELQRQLEQARNLATRRIVAYGENGMVTITPDAD